MGRCLSAVAGRARGAGPHGEVGDFSISRRETRGWRWPPFPCPVAAACPMRARARAMRRGHRVSVAKGRPDRNAGGEGRLRGRDGGACSECRVNNFHLRGCSRPCRRRRRKTRRGGKERLSERRGQERMRRKRKLESSRAEAGGRSAAMAPVIGGQRQRCSRR